LNQIILLHTVLCPIEKYTEKRKEEEEDGDSRERPAQYENLCGRAGVGLAISDV
jgi:hypothetical protein